MSEILGFTPGVTQAHKKCAMKMKERKNDCHVNFLLEGGLHKAVSED